MSDQNFKEFVDQGVAAANNYFYTGRYANALEILSAVKQVDANSDIVELLIQKICCEQFNIKSPDLNYYFGEHWLGQSLENKSIEIFCDQGMGDTINLLRYVKQLKKEYPNCKIVLNYYAFFNQFERLMQNQSYIDLFTPFHTKCDYHTNIMSLPCILNGIQLDIYYPVHFDKILDLPPPPQIYFEEFESLNLSDKNKIGIVWQTNIDNPLSKQKSINVELFDIFKDLDFEFYCLQPQAETPDWIDCLPIEDLHDTARFITQCDFIISVDTVTLHLAGVLDKKTFGLIPFDHDPRWGKDSDNIWYPSVELFRQNNDQDWSIALNQIKDKIKISKDKKMNKSKMMSGSPILTGDNNIPGLKIHKEVLEVLPQIEESCHKMGLDYFPIIVEFVRYDEMAELASYGGFPVRYPHWRFGMEYEEMARGYEHGQYRISEMVINACPCYIYCMDSNTLVDNVDVIAHAIGHNDFFKNNIFFEPTDENMMNKLANHGTRIRKYMARWGHEVVTEFIDHCLRLDTLIDPHRAWQKKIKQSVVRDERKYQHPKRLKSQNNYMDEWVNSKDYIDQQNEDIKKQETAHFLDIFEGSCKDILGYLKDNAPLKPWQQDIISMLYDEAMYFSPQRATKMINEGWASFVDYHILCRMGLASLGQPSEDAGIWHYAEHKMRVLGGKYSQNPYKLGFELFLDIEDRWNKGKFGDDWENCNNMHEKENWDKKLGLGMDKIFEVRKNYNDFLMIQEFFTPEFCEKKQFFEWKHFPNGEYKIVNRDFKSIKKKLLQKYLNAGLPDIRLLDPNHLGKGWFYMEHQSDGRTLYDSYARETITSIQKIWKNVVVLSTKNKDRVECVYVCDGSQQDKNVHYMTREEYEKEFLNN